MFLCKEVNDWTLFPRIHKRRVSIVMQLINVLNEIIFTTTSNNHVTYLHFLAYCVADPRHHRHQHVFLALVSSPLYAVPYTLCRPAASNSSCLP